MKNFFTFTLQRFLSLSWYIWLFIVCVASLGNQCGCVCQLNAPTDNNPIESPPIDNTLPTLSLQFEKLCYDRNSNRLVVIIKNTGKEIAKELSLRCTNISEDETSRAAVLFNHTVTTTSIPVLDLAAGASTEEIYVAIDFQTAREALLQMEIICGQQVTTIDTIQLNRYPINMLPKEAIFIIAKQGETGECKWKLVTDSHEQSIDFIKFQLTAWRNQGKDIIVSIEDIGTILDQSTNYKMFSGTELEKLAKQQEIVVKVKNNTPDNLNFIYFTLLGSNGEEIDEILIKLTPEIKIALLPAASTGNVDMLKQAIADGADVNNAKNIQEETALHLSTKGGHQEVVHILLDKGADTNATDNEGNTALHVAASQGQQEIAKLLLAQGADKNIKNNDNKTAADLGKDQEIKDLINNWGN